MTSILNGFASVPLTSQHGWLATGHHGGDHGSSFVDHLLRGFAWRTGGDAASFLFHLAPTVITVVVAIVLLGVGVRWLRNHSR